MVNEYSCSDVFRAGNVQLRVAEGAFEEICICMYMRGQTAIKDVTKTTQKKKHFACRKPT